MSHALLPTTDEIKATFSAEIVLAGGTVSNSIDDGGRLYLRSVLPLALEVKPSDRIQGGVALIATDAEIRVHPYVFRQVCSNGAIMPRAIRTRRIDRLAQDAPAETVAAVRIDLREAVRACSAREAFDASTEQMRSAAETQADMAMMMMSILTRLETSHQDQLQAILMNFFSAQDRSVFGMVNAVTSVARDARDPAVRWRLEELGGGIAARALAPLPTRPLQLVH